MDDMNIVYGVTGMGLIFIPEQRAQELAHVFVALTTAKTWGEFRKMLPSETYEKYLQLSEHYQGPKVVEGKDLSSFYIADDIPFKLYDVFSETSQESQPGNPEIEMSHWVPGDIQEKYGRLTQYYAEDGNVPSGKILELDEKKMNEIIHALEIKGFRCRRDDALIEAAYGSLINREDSTDPSDL